MPPITSLSSAICDVTVSPGPGLEPLTLALEAARRILRDYEQGDPTAAQPLQGSLRALSQEVVSLHRRHAQSAITTDLRQFILEVAASGVHDRDVPAADLTLADAHAERGWPGLLAAMLLTSAAQWPSAPSIADAPDWLWGDYTSWLFSSQHAPASVGALLRHLEDLHRWIERNPGSSAVRAASDAWLGTGARVLRGGNPTQQRRYAEVRGQILTRLLSLKDGYIEPLPVARLGRPLRVGFVAERLTETVESRALLAQFEHLDPAAFDVRLFVLNETYSAIEQYARSKAVSFEALPADLALQLESLRRTELDVLVFGQTLSGDVGDITRLALHRIAPLQVANDRAGISSGLPEIDFYVSDTNASDMGETPMLRPKPDTAGMGGTPMPHDPTAFTERLGLLRGPAHCWAMPVECAGASELTREALELPAEDPLLATVVTNAATPPAALDAWAQILAAAPTARLLVALATDDNDAFCTRVEAALGAHGVATERVSLFPADIAAPEEIRGLLRVADVYLDSGDASASAWLLEAAKLGRPAAARRTSNVAATVLPSLGTPELLTESADVYIALAAKLANDSAKRAELGERITTATETGSASCFDTLAASDALAALLEPAFDEVAAVGREVFRAEREPIRCYASETPEESRANIETALAQGDAATAAFESLLLLRADPTDVDARMLRGRALLAEGHAASSAAYLLAAVQQCPKDASLWFTLATALHQQGQTPDAIKALETSLRLEEGNLDGWLMMLDLSEAIGATDIASETLEVLRQLAPDDPRVMFRG